MKMRTFAIASLLVLSMMAVARSVHAQDLVANIPFEFMTATTTLPAGDYTVKELSSGVLLQNRAEHASAFVMTIPAQAKRGPVDSKLIFNRYGNRYFLSEIWSSESEIGKQLPKSAREKELLKELANGATIDNREQVTVIARVSRAKV